MAILKRVLKTIGLLVAVAVITIIGLYFATDNDKNVPDTVATDSSIPHIEMALSFTNSSASGYRCADENVKAITPDIPVPRFRLGATAFSTIVGPDADLTHIAANAANYTDVVLFVASECSTHVGADFQREQMGVFPQAQRVVIPNAGHDMFTENPKDSLAVLRDYFA